MSIPIKNAFPPCRLRPQSPSAANGARGASPFTMTRHRSPRNLWSLGSRKKKSRTPWPSWRWRSAIAGNLAAGRNIANAFRLQNPAPRRLVDAVDARIISKAKAQMSRDRQNPLNLPAPARRINAWRSIANALEMADSAGHNVNVLAARIKRFLPLPRRSSWGNCVKLSRRYPEVEGHFNDAG